MAGYQRSAMQRERFLCIGADAGVSVCAMKVLVTGATGFVGSHSVRALLDAGHEVRMLVRSGLVAWARGWEPTS